MTERARLLSLDAFRGLTVAAMVLVNNPGTWRAVYPPLLHAEWHGWTPTDLVFPFFVFVVGVAIPLALGGRRARGASRASLVLRIVRRAAVIFALGILLHAYPTFDFSTVRIPGVLQRIAVCYLAAALVFLVTGWRAQAALAGGLLLGYWAAMTLVPVPGFGPGNLSKEGSLAAYIDRVVLGPHIWSLGRVYDPEGILSTVPAVATALLGVLTGRFLTGGHAPRLTIAGLAGAGVVGVAMGELWSRWFPINKALWTSSYAVLASGMALLGLALCYWLIDVRGMRRWAQPFIALGVNALAAFFLSTFVARVLLLVDVETADGRTVSLHRFLFEQLFAPWATMINASLAFALVYLLLWIAAMWPLYRSHVRLSV